MLVDFFSGLKILSKVANKVDLMSVSRLFNGVLIDRRGQEKSFVFYEFYPVVVVESIGNR